MKRVMTIKELMAEGYKEKDLRAISRSEDFAEVGFHSGNKKTSTICFWVDRLDRYLMEREMK